MDLAQLKAMLDEALAKMAEFTTAQTAEMKAMGESSAKTAEQISAMDKIIADITDELKAATDELKDLKSKAERLPQGMPQVKTLGEQFTESEAFKEFKPAKGNNVSMDIPTLWTPQVKDTLTGATLGNAPTYLYVPQRVPGIIAPAMVDRHVRDLLPVVQTGMGAVDFIREVVSSGSGSGSGQSALNAATVAEGNLKPESTLVFEEANAPVRTLAHWLPVTRQILEDAAGLRGYIDTRLLYGLALAEDDQLLYGTGTGSEIQGIITADGVQTYNWSAGLAGDTKLDAIRRAMTLARLSNYPVTGIVLHPSDWEDIELLKGSDEHYIWINVTQGGQMQLWRVPVVDSTAINPLTFLTGAFSMGATLWDRMQAGVRASDSHSDFFTRNMWAILAEERLTQTIYRPSAFVVGTFDSAPGS